MELTVGEEPSPAPFSLRMVAFVMDSILVFFVACTMVHLFFPTEKTAARETWTNDYKIQLQALEESLQQGNQSSGAEMQRKIEAFLQEPSLLEFLSVIISSMFWAGLSYWFLGERFFAGSSLGKRMFSIASLSLHDKQPPRTGICFLRAFLKTISVLHLLLIINFLLPLFNRRRMAGHDYVCRTMVVRRSTTRERKEASTISRP